MTGGDGNDWALDEDLAMTKRALENIVEFSDLDHCDIIHSVWWNSLYYIEPKKLKQRQVFCHLSGEPYRYLGIPEFKSLSSIVTCWIPQSKQAEQQLQKLGYPYQFVPYAVDLETFKPINKEQSDFENIYSKWRIPKNKYLIGSFQRDTEGSNLRDPKLVKGPDIFFEIVRALWRRNLPIHVVLAGPRRNWLRSQLISERIPFTFVGEPVEGDDLHVNTLPKSMINRLYNLIDLYLVSSRSEGGPRAVLEAAATRCRIISTPVGLAQEVLVSECVYHTPISAIEIIEKDIEGSFLKEFTDKHLSQVSKNHCVSVNAQRFQGLYNSSRPKSFDRVKGLLDREVDGLRTIFRRPIWPSHNTFMQENDFKVGLWHKFFSPPYGGGNQFMIVLRKALLQRGVKVAENILDSEIDAYLLNSIHFDVEKFLQFRRQYPIKVVHRIDGPINLIRGHDWEKDELCYDLNAKFAYSTIIQSNWTLEKIVEMGYHPVKPVIIHNMIDEDIFNRNGRIAFDPGRKTRLISTSWSGNPRKGGPIYKWIEENLDWNRFEYTFVGHTSENFNHIRLIPPVPSEELAILLRQHDIYITASQNDPCSNALIEALSCGLPALYYDDGGHPELVGQGGLPFRTKEEIFTQLDTLVEYYQLFQNLISVPSTEEVTRKYLKLLREAGLS